METLQGDVGANSQSLKIAVLTNHFSGFDALSGLDLSRVPVSLLITNDTESHNGIISGGVELENLGVEILKLKSFDMSEDVENLISLEMDILLVMGFQRLVPRGVIDSVKLGAFGFHGSSEFLPKGRGRSPINWELIAGKDRFISHMFRLEPDADSGEIFDHFIFDINDFDDCKTVYYKASISMRRMLERTVPKIINGTPSGKTQEGEPTFFPKRSQKDGRIDWSMGTIQIHNWVRALTRPYPGAFSGGITIWRGQPFTDVLVDEGSVPGEVIETFNYGDFLVRTGDGSFLVIDHEGPLPDVGEILGD